MSVALGPEQYYICKSMSLWAIEKQASRETTNISKANDLLTTLSRNIQCLLRYPLKGLPPGKSNPLRLLPGLLLKPM